MVGRKCKKDQRFRIKLITVALLKCLGISLSVFDRKAFKSKYKVFDCTVRSP